MRKTQIVGCLFSALVAILLPVTYGISCYTCGHLELTPDSHSDASNDQNLSDMLANASNENCTETDAAGNYHAMNCSEDVQYCMYANKTIKFTEDEMMYGYTGFVRGCLKWNSTKEPTMPTVGCHDYTETVAGAIMTHERNLTSVMGRICICNEDHCNKGMVGQHKDMVTQGPTGGAVKTGIAMATVLSAAICFGLLS